MISIIILWRTQALMAKVERVEAKMLAMSPTGGQTHNNVNVHCTATAVIGDHCPVTTHDIIRCYY